MNEGKRQRIQELKEKISDNIDGALEIAPLVLVAGFTIGAGVSSIVKDKIAEHKMYKLSEQVETNDEISRNNKRMLKAAYEDNLTAFKRALKRGASIKTTNQFGQDALMIAFTNNNANYKNCEVANYILDTPELANKIDYNRHDVNGNSLQDIINIRIDKTTEYNPVLQNIKNKVNKNLEKQTKEEAQGKTRSDTYYGMMNMVDKNITKR